MAEPGPEKFGAFIEKMRRNLRWSQHQFGEKVGARSSYITSVENGETWPDDYFIDRCAEFLRVPHEYLAAMLGPKPQASADKRPIK